MDNYNDKKVEQGYGSIDSYLFKEKQAYFSGGLDKYSATYYLIKAALDAFIKCHSQEMIHNQYYVLNDENLIWRDVWAVNYEAKIALKEFSACYLTFNHLYCDSSLSNENIITESKNILRRYNREPGNLIEFEDYFKDCLEVLLSDDEELKWTEKDESFVECKSSSSKRITKSELNEINRQYKQLVENDACSKIDISISESKADVTMGKKVSFAENIFSIFSSPNIINYLEPDSENKEAEGPLIK